MAIIAISVEYEIHIDDAGPGSEHPVWISWRENIEDEAEADRRLETARATHPNDMFRKVRVTREVFGDDPPP